MTENDIAILQQSIDKVVRFRCTDGEVIVAKIDVVDVNDGEIVFELLSTTAESKYEKLDVQPAYLLRFEHVVSVEPIS